MLKNISQLIRDQQQGLGSSKTLVEKCFANIAANGDEGRRAFTQLYEKQALKLAAKLDAERLTTRKTLPLAGIPIAIKDLFDISGEPTLAGSKSMAATAVANSDAKVVEDLKAAGAVIVGKTNMTEFAYSGLGINPHYGTPANALDSSRIPGGSSSGSGVAVALGYCAASIASDTSGSVRIPAAFNGVVGFKPSRERVSRAGMLPLSMTQDAVGIIAPSVECCAQLDSVLTHAPAEAFAQTNIKTLRFSVAKNILTENLDAKVAHAFERALRVISEAGAKLVDQQFSELSELQAIGLGGILGPEAFAWHRPRLKHYADLYDSRVLSRIKQSSQVLAADYIDCLSLREKLCQSFSLSTQPFDALLCPTVPIVPPKFEEIDSDESYFRLNKQVLSNCYMFNILDRPAVSIPCHQLGELPVGLMIVAAQGDDRRLLSMAAALERLFNS